MEAVLKLVQFALELLLPVLGCILCAGLLSGVLKALTLIEDPSIGFVARLSGLLMFAYFGLPSLVLQIREYSLRIWSGAEFFF